MLGITMYNEEGGVATLELKDGTSWELNYLMARLQFGAEFIDIDELNEWSVQDLVDAGWESV